MTTMVRFMTELNRRLGAKKRFDPWSNPLSVLHEKKVQKKEKPRWAKAEKRRAQLENGVEDRFALRLKNEIKIEAQKADE